MWIDGWTGPRPRFNPHFWGGVFWGVLPDAGGPAELASDSQSLSRCEALLRRLDNALAGQDFLLGGRLSLADIPAATSLYRYFELDIERPALPNVEAWYGRLKTRPAYRKNVMLPFGELRGRLDS